MSETPDQLQINPDDQEELLRSLDKAAADIDAGKGAAIEDVRKRISSWAAK